MPVAAKFHHTEEQWNDGSLVLPTHFARKMPDSLNARLLCWKISKSEIKSQINKHSIFIDRSSLIPSIDRVLIAAEFSWVEFIRSDACLSSSSSVCLSDGCAVRSNRQQHFIYRLRTREFIFTELFYWSVFMEQFSVSDVTCVYNPPPRTYKSIDLLDILFASSFLPFQGRPNWRATERRGSEFVKENVPLTMWGILRQFVAFNEHSTEDERAALRAISADKTTSASSSSPRLRRNAEKNGTVPDGGGEGEKGAGGSPTKTTATSPAATSKKAAMMKNRIYTSQIAYPTVNGAPVVNHGGRILWVQKSNKWPRLCI